MSSSSSSSSRKHKNPDDQISQDTLGIYFLLFNNDINSSNDSNIYGFPINMEGTNTEKDTPNKCINNTTHRNKNNFNNR